MGLYSHLNDVSSDSIPLLLVAIIANCLNYLRSFLYGVIESLGFSPSRFDQSMGDVVGDGLFGAMGSGLAGLIVLTEQMNVNRVFDYRCSGGGGGGGGGGERNGGGSEEQCVVCLCRLMDGDQVRRIACRHVFHKECLDGWLFDHLNLTCPLCRSPLVSEERVAATQRRVAGDLVTWFSLR